MSGGVSAWLDDLGLSQYAGALEENDIGWELLTVCRFMGDGIMAMFGAPIASERHATEACRAALEIQTGIVRYSATLKASHGDGTKCQ